MELEKVLRIVAIFIAFATLAIWVTTELMFPDSSRYIRIPLLFVLIYGVCRLVWAKTPCRK